MSDKIDIIRPFNWGVLIVGDCNDQPLPELEPDSTISVGLTSIIIPVRHAQDVPPPQEGPFSVSVSCHFDTPPSTRPDFEALIEIPTGQFSR